MVADRSAVFEFNIRGNFDEKLKELRDDIKQSQIAWARLAGSFRQYGAVFRAPADALDEMRKKGQKTALAAEMLKQAFVHVDTKAGTMARALNRLNSEQNRLNSTLAAELKVLDLTARGHAPRIAELRGRTAGTVKFTKALEKLAAAEEFARLNAEAGLPVQQKFASSLSTQAIAAERAAKAQKELAVQQLLAKQGLDKTGKPLAAAKPPVDKETELRARVEREKVKAADDARLRQLRIEAGLLDANGNKIGTVSKQMTGLGDETKKTNGIFSQFLFTFRRLVGVMAVFTVARVVVRGFNQMIAAAVRFNAAIETNRVGLAGLIAAAGDVRDLQGGRLSLEEQLGRAQNIAIGQMKKLQAQALETAASYEEVSTAFTQAVAPGISAGLTLDEIRNVTVQISQAATGLGVAQNQLAEEIRSLFQGTINPRNTRIATALGITSQDIRRAKEVGNLFEFISGRFAAISATGKRLMNTFTGQLSNAADAFSQLLATSSKPLFEQLKTGLLEMQQAIFQVVDEQAIFSPKALQAFDGLFQGLARGVLAIRQAFSRINIQGFADSFGLIGEALGFVAGVLAKAFVTFFDVAAPAVTLLKLAFALVTSLVGGFSKLNDLTFGWLGTIVDTTVKLTLALVVLKKFGVAMAAILRVSKSVYLAWKLSGGAMIATTLASTKLVKTMTTLRTVIKTTVLLIMLIAIALTAISKLLPQGTKDTIFDGIADALNWVTSGLDEIFDRMVKLPEEAVDATSQGLGLVGDSLRSIASDIQEATLDLEKAAREIESARQASLRQLGTSPEVSNQIGIAEQERLKAGEATLAVTNLILEKEAERKILIEKQVDLLKQQRVASTAAVLNAANQNALRDRIDALREEHAAIEALRKPVIGGQPGAKGPLNLADSQRATELAVEIQRLEGISLRQAEILKRVSGQNLEIFKKRSELNGQERIIVDQIVEARRKQVEIENLAFDNAVARMRAVAEEYNFAEIEQQNMRERLLAAETEQQVLAASLEGNQRKVALVKASADALQAQIEVSRAVLLYQRSEKELLLQIQKAKESTNKETRLGVAALEEQLYLLQQAKVLDLARLESIRRLREEEVRLQRLRESGSFGEGTRQGLLDFKEANSSLYEIGQNFARNTADQLGNFVGSTFRSSLAAAFDPTQNFDLATAVTNLGLDIAASLVTDLAKNALAGLISPVVAAAPEDLTKVAAAAEAAAIQTTAATTAGATVVSSAALAGSELLTGANIAGQALFAWAQAAAGALSASKVAAVGGLGSAKGGPIFGDARDFTKAKGFARGGRTFPRRPRTNIDSRDTVPAWLRPGEWVIRPEAVKHYGHDLMAALNSRKINPALLRGLGKPAAAPLPKRSFATGGPVRDVGMPSQAAQVTYALQFHDEQTMDRALAVGSESTLRFARRHRSAYRAALGI